MKKLLLSLAILGLPFTAMADDVSLRQDHPDTYTVIKGDTLWDISGRFLQQPWEWPEIWYVNPQIDNPHLIYPGDVISLVYVDGQPRLMLDRRNYKMSPGDTKLSPTVRIEPAGAAIPAIPLNEIDKFLSRSRVVTSDELLTAPYVLMGAEEHLVLGAGDRLYTRGELTDGIRSFGLYRKGETFVDPETEEILGVQALDIGTVRLVAKGDDDVNTFEATRTTEEIRIGDRLLPDEERAIDAIFYPSSPNSDIEGVIIAVEGGLTQVGTMDVIVINRGEREGLEIGNVMAIYKKGSTVRDRITGESVQLPDERAGLLMVFRTFEKMSYALVLESLRPLRVEDKVRNP